MKTVRFLLLLLLAAAPLQTLPQPLPARRLVVADVETLLPVAGVSVVMGHHTAISDSAGTFSLADSCRSLLLTHINYESRLVNVDEVRRDTVYIVSKLLSLQGVVVFGKARPDDGLEELRKRLRMARTEAELAGATPQQGFNLLGLVSYLLPKKWLKGKKQQRRERLKKTLDNY